MVLNLISLGGVLCINSTVYNDHHSDHPRELNADSMIHAHVMHCAQACRVNSIMQSVRMGKLVVHAPLEHKASKQACM